MDEISRELRIKNCIERGDQLIGDRLISTQYGSFLKCFIQASFSLNLDIGKRTARFRRKDLRYEI